MLGHQEDLVLMKRAAPMGFTLIELAIIVALIGVLLAIAMPQLGDWIANQRIRTAAEGVVNGLQLARTEAVRRNSLAELQIAEGGIAWNLVAGGETVQTRDAGAGGGICILDASWNCLGLALPATSVTYNGLGRMVAPASFALLYGSSNKANRAMCAVVIANTPRMCDPRRNDSSDPQACFAFDGTAVTRIVGCPLPP